jgi:hypothetical protein
MKTKEEYNEYQRKYQLERYHRRRKGAILALGGKCKKCCSIENLELDHIDHTQKSFNISQLWSVSEQRYLTELVKCQILCASCHMSKSKQEGSVGSNGGWNRIDHYDHGTGLMYQKDKCRCGLCQKWRRLYRSKQVDYHGQFIDT